ncbi:unnamed protein product [Euphydryas editha]|uniref:Uncharacterized protein n=1 Tax=Euphydryas editha TaxID=104508 RepID=A0AAU9UUI0_EUPED|nr:unnamed protein product [Euphydryas editha]
MVTLLSITILDHKIYDVPYEVSRPPTPDVVKSDFQKLRENFENASQKIEKEEVIPKPILTKKVWKSSENVTDEFKNARSQVEKKFSTDVKRYKKKDTGRVGLSLPKRKESQLDVDRENVSTLFFI